MDGRSDAARGFGDETGDAMGFQVRIGYHPGVRVYVAAAAATAAAAGAAAEQSPDGEGALRAVHGGGRQESTVTADAQDPDGDALTYRWRAPAGTFPNAADRQTPWTAPMQPGPVPVTVTVDDGKGGTATDTVTIQVIRPPVKEFVFEDVHFDFDRYSLRPEATRIARRGGHGAAGEPRAAARGRRAHLQHRHGGIQPGARRAARERGARLPGRAAASAPTGCARSATAKSGRSTTTPAKKRAASTAAPPWWSGSRDRFCRGVLTGGSDGSFCGSEPPSEPARREPPVRTTRQNPTSERLLIPCNTSLCPTFSLWSFANPDTTSTT